MMPSFFSCWENSLYICGETQHSSQKQFHSIHSHSHPNLQKPNLVLLYSTKFRHFLHTRPGGGGGGVCLNCFPTKFGSHDMGTTGMLTSKRRMYSSFGVISCVYAHCFLNPYGQFEAPEMPKLDS